jgi:hypothetical protein
MSERVQYTLSDTNNLHSDERHKHINLMHFQISVSINYLLKRLNPEPRFFWKLIFFQPVNKFTIFFHTCNLLLWF